MLRPQSPSADISIEKAAAAINGMIAERAKEALEGRQAEPGTPALPKPHAPGVYFGMTSAEYHADPSLGGGDLKRLLRSPTDYWFLSHLNPARPPDTDSPSKLKGRALHALVLEGEAAFTRAFAEEPSPEGHPGCLVTLEHLRAKCRELGEPVSGTKAELAKRVRAKDPEAIVFDDILATFRVMVERDGLEVLKRDVMREVRQAAQSMTLNPHLARAFEGGIPEVSVFWIDERGLPCKCRLDYLKPRTIVDIKTCANARERPFDVAAMLAVAEYRYDISARHYLDGYAYLHQFAAEGRVFGPCPLNDGWHARIAAPDAIRWTWIFTQTQDAPVTIGVELLPDSPALNRAAREIAVAKSRFEFYAKKFGAAMWITDVPIKRLQDSDLPVWMREATEEYA